MIWDLLVLKVVSFYGTRWLNSIEIELQFLIRRKFRSSIRYSNELPSGKQWTLVWKKLSCPAFYAIFQWDIIISVPSLYIDERAKMRSLMHWCGDETSNWLMTEIKDNNALKTQHRCNTTQRKKRRFFGSDFVSFREQCIKHYNKCTRQMDENNRKSNWNMVCDRPKCINVWKS